MKKIFISMALVSLALAGNARTTGGDNLVKNGSFDDPGYQQETGEWATWGDPMANCQDLSELPGWALNTGGRYNGGAMVMVGEEYYGDGDTRPEDDNMFLRLFTDTDNSWTANRVSQVVTGLTSGTSYTLTFALMGKWPELEVDGWQNDPTWGVSVSEVDTDGASKGREIGNWAFTDVPLYWETKTYTFTATSDKVYLEFVMDYQNYDNYKHSQGSMGIDCVDLYDPNGTSGVAELEVADTEASAEYFNLQGVRVAEPVAGGLYIRRQGTKAAKVVF